jgi:hypothetical protein
MSERANDGRRLYSGLGLALLFRTRTGEGAGVDRRVFSQRNIMHQTRFTALEANEQAASVGLNPKST